MAFVVKRQKRRCGRTVDHMGRWSFRVTCCQHWLEYEQFADLSHFGKWMSVGPHNASTPCTRVTRQLHRLPANKQVATGQTFLCFWLRFHEHEGNSKRSKQMSQNDAFSTTVQHSIGVGLHSKNNHTQFSFLTMSRSYTRSSATA